MYVLSEKTTIMYLSLQNINKEINPDINVEKLIKRSYNKDEYLKIINDIIYNFSNIKVLLLKLKDYNINLNTELQNNNFHCKTLDHNIHKKRILIYINYKKLYETFVTVIKYFSQHANILINKLNDDKNYIFLVHSKEDNDDIFIKNKNNIINETNLNLEKVDIITENETSDD